ncbi:MAG: VOC family protein [Abyssibacter sp.]|uniref:VOC family protein n=1 Tax=Abyssibacter sp. TaxID=2320200 RepID=UPI00321BB8D8
MRVSAIPAGYHSVTPYLFISGADAAIAFYIEAFGAEEVMRLPSPDGLVMHAEIRVGDSHIMLADAMEDAGVHSPDTLGGVASSLMLYVDDVDAVYQRAVDAGATEMRPIEDQFWGDRMGTVIDPFGHQWSIATHVEDVDDEEMQRRFTAMMDDMDGAA